MFVKKILIIFFLLFFSLFVVPPQTNFSAECSLEAIQLAGQDKTQISAIKDQCQLESSNHQNTISEFEKEKQKALYQISITSLQIEETKQKITDTKGEIDILGTRIQSLDQSLNYLSKSLIVRIVEGYKKRTFSLLDIIFKNNNANDLFGQIKYLKTAQDNNQKLLYTVQETKSNYEEQVKLREEKKKELDNLNNNLLQLEADLENKKEKLIQSIADQQNQKAATDKIMAIAQAQLAGFKSFVSSAGVGTISANQFGSGSDGAYYSQRDERWANQNIGYSSENILNVGCLLTSVSMVAKHYGDNVTPGNIASDPSRFYGYTAYMSLPWKSVAGRSYYGGIDVDQELANGNYVIVGVGGCSYGGSHFIVLTKKDGDDYIMNDPIYGPDLKLSTHYSKSFCSTATFK
jgi:peptidoglycan hydrolase CwlO-like protein